MRVLTRMHVAAHGKISSCFVAYLFSEQHFNSGKQFRSATAPGQASVRPLGRDPRRPRSFQQSHARLRLPFELKMLDCIFPGSYMMLAWDVQARDATCGEGCHLYSIRPRLLRKDHEGPLLSGLRLRSAVSSICGTKAEPEYGFQWIPNDH